MEPLFSEFSYGYAITEELAAGKFGQIIGAPIFPSLYAEGQNGGGYDVQLPRNGRPLFLQFKLSHYLWRSNASEWDSYGEPHYRMHLRPRRLSEQHDLLINLEQSGNEVYYVTPDFYTIEELNEFYISNTVADHSSYFSPSEIGVLPDEHEHYVTFVLNDMEYDLHSDDSQKLRYRYSKNDIENRQVSRLEQQSYRIDTQYLDGLANRIVNIFSKFVIYENKLVTLKEQISQSESTRDKAKFISYLARTYIDAEFFIISHKS